MSARAALSDGGCVVSVRKAGTPRSGWLANRVPPSRRGSRGRALGADQRLQTVLEASLPADEVVARRLLAVGDVIPFCGQDFREALTARQHRDSASERQ